MPTEGHRPCAPGSDSHHTTPLAAEAVATLSCSRRSRRPPSVDPSPTPAMTLAVRPLEEPAQSAVSFPVARLAAVTDRRHGKARNGGLESGICAHSAFRPDSRARRRLRMLPPARRPRNRGRPCPVGPAGGDQEVPGGRNAVLRRRSQARSMPSSSWMPTPSAFAILRRDSGHLGAVASRERTQRPGGVRRAAPVNGPRPQICHAMPDLGDRELAELRGPAHQRSRV